MKCVFLSGQTTCALLLGAGLLLRAQAALHWDGPPSAARTRSGALIERAPPEKSPRIWRAPRVVRSAAGQDEAAAPRGKAGTQERKQVAHAAKRKSGRQR
jgi:hypothetical protein